MPLPTFAHARLAALAVLLRATSWLNGH